MRKWRLSIVLIIFILLASGYWYWQAGIKIPPQIPPELQNKENDTIDTSTWKTYRNEQYGFEVRYPEKLDTQFIRIHSSLPPEITITENITSCEHREVIVGNSFYCVDLVTDSAAGTAYRRYQYSIQRDGRQIHIDFMLAYPNCGNYYGISNQQEMCEKEKQIFNPDLFVHQILSTFKFIK